eukprot:CAMPEP_0114507742 /NCGR_PEP_ID=MMETSP0109-20121206/12185_1 /TAXON_ID=29199 /ORGANISM="Chlorarachnion reptans, Strain CCCM449" /LENGTH=33 /DNA_ID= /DNA_START= /DNA_END= /DNA_ORIENTATION=
MPPVPGGVTNLVRDAPNSEETYEDECWEGNWNN